MTDNSILSELTYFPDRGALVFNGVRYLLIRPETLQSMNLAEEQLLAGGFAGGKLSGLQYKETLGLTEAEAVEFMCRMGSEIGWGRFQLIELDEAGNRLIVEVEHSPFAEGYEEPSQTGVCHMTRGVLSGLAAGLFGVEVVSSEVLCMAKGDPQCRFEIEPAK